MQRMSLQNSCTTPQTSRTTLYARPPAPSLLSLRAVAVTTLKAFPDVSRASCQVATFPLPQRHAHTKEPSFHYRAKCGSAITHQGLLHFHRHFRDLIMPPLGILCCQLPGAFGPPITLAPNRVNWCVGRCQGEGRG